LPGRAALLVNDRVSFTSRYGPASTVYGEYSENLGNAGEDLILRLPDPQQAAVLRFSYDDDTSVGWPGGADGNGSSLEIVDFMGNYRDPSNWRASGQLFGTPDLGPALGDFDADGDLDVEDVDALTSTIASGIQNIAFDMTGDAAVTFADLNEWVVILKGTSFGDMNLDGAVDSVDFAIWNAHAFRHETLWSSGDVNANGATDLSDFNIWNANKFLSSSPNTAAGSESRGSLRTPRAALTTASVTFRELPMAPAVVDNVWAKRTFTDRSTFVGADSTDSEDSYSRAPEYFQSIETNANKYRTSRASRRHETDRAHGVTGSDEDSIEAVFSLSVMEL